MQTRTVVAAFLVSALILFCGTFFHWQTRSEQDDLHGSRIGLTRDLTGRLSELSANDEQYQAWLSILQYAFNERSDLLLIGVLGNRREPLYLRTRMNEQETTMALLAPRGNEIWKKEAAAFGDGSGNEGFLHYLQLGAGGGGRLLLIFDKEAYAEITRRNVRRFLIIAFVGLLGLLLANLLRRTISRRRVPAGVTAAENGVSIAEDADTPHEPAAESETDPLGYLVNRNSQLEQEVETLSELRNFMHQAGRATGMEELLGLLFGEGRDLLEVERLSLLLDAGHAPPLAAAASSVRLVGEERLARLLEIGGESNPADDGCADRSHRLCLPLETAGTVFGMLILRIPRHAPAFRERELARACQFARQIALPVHNFMLYSIAIRDGLTGLYTRRFFDTTLRQAVTRPDGAGPQISLVMVDLDHFKEVNDRFGHPSGDRILREVAQLIAKRVRRSDFACRYGGEEIAILLPETGGDAAVEVAEGIRREISARQFIIESGEKLRISASFGVACLESRTNPGIMDGETLLAHADGALYCSKKNGRNMVTRHGSGTEEGAAAERLLTAPLAR